jgi:hypothetical protein
MGKKASYERVHIARADFAGRATLYVVGWLEIRRWTADFIAFTFMVHYCFAGFMLQNQNIENGTTLGNSS